MVFLIVFKTSLSRPLSYHWGQDIYEACPACVHAHELRPCDGETTVSFEICGRHIDTAQSTALDDVVLNEIRTLVHPLYSPVPTFPIVTGMITAESREDLHKKVKITTAIEHNVASRPGVNVTAHFTATGSGGDVSGKRMSGRRTEFGLPHPKITYAHGSGCIYSQEPDVVLKPRAAVAMMDHYARERLRNITALLERDISCNLGPRLDINLGMADQIDETKGSPKSTRTEETASNSESDIYPVTLFSESAADESSATALARHALNAAESEARALLRAEKTRLEECLATSSLAKGIYLKRCNWQWVNGVGDALLVNGGAEGKGGIVGGKGARGFMMDKAVRGGRVEQEAKSEFGSFDAGPILSQGHVDEEVVDASTLTRTSTPSMTTSTTAATTISSISLGSPDSSSTGPLETTVCTGSLEISEGLDSRSGYGYALLCHDDGTESPIPGTSASSLVSASRACPPNSSSFGYSMLQNREQMVRSGQCTGEDLCITSWGYNRAARNMPTRQQSRIATATDGGE